MLHTISAATSRATLLAIAALTTLALAVPTATAQAQVLTVTPFCDSTTAGAPASGFQISVLPSTGVTLSIMDANGVFNPQPFTPLPEFTIGVSFPPGVGATTFKLYDDPNGNGVLDPGEALRETLNEPDPCAPPLPTAKEQCKNGGWRTFGDTFKNQGQCVAFVQRGPQP
jgi:hypothetical protein